MGSSSDFLGQTSQSHRSADSFQVLHSLELLGYGKQVYGHMLVYKLDHSLENHAVLRLIETTRRELFHSLVHTIRLDK